MGISALPYPCIISLSLELFELLYSGKYVADGRWSDTAVSKQCGAAVLLRRMAEMKVIDFHGQPLPEPADSPLVAKYSNRKSKNTLVLKQVEDLQCWLNTFPGVFVKVATVSLMKRPLMPIGLLPGFIFQMIPGGRYHRISTAR